jgi:phospholipid/cholesterol/gamma-HCH transport system substrate-binding protein
MAGRSGHSRGVMADRHPGVKFALFAVLCVLAAAYVVSVTGNYDRIPFLTQTSKYEAVLSDVSGLFPGDDVRLSGVPVGRVDAIGVEKGKAVVTFRIRPDVEVLDTWEVGVRWRNIIGSRHLYLFPVGEGAPLAEGARIPVERSRAVADIGRFFNQLTPLLEAIDPEAQNRLLTELNKALEGRADEVSELTADVGSLGNTIADRETEVRRVLRNGNRFLAEYNRRDGELRAILDDLADVGGVLRERNDEVLAAVTDIAEVQQEFGDLLAANDAELADIVSNLQVVTRTIGDNRRDLDRALGTLPDGLATYNLISRWGQWFNVRGVAAQVQRNGEVLFCEAEGGGRCAVPNDTPENREPQAMSLAPARTSALDVVTGMALRGGAR